MGEIFADTQRLGLRILNVQHKGGFSEMAQAFYKNLPIHALKTKKSFLT
jgi:hypothetical protein